MHALLWRDETFVDFDNNLNSAVATLREVMGDSAVDAAATAVRLDPASWRVRADLAFFQLAAGRYHEALLESRAILLLDPSSAVARDMLLTAAERIGAEAEALDAALIHEPVRAAAESMTRAASRSNAGSPA